MPTSSSPATTTTSVLIAGAGPVGLALACELGMRGVDCLVVEKRDGKLHVPKMSLVSAGSMEYCRRWGIAQKVRTAVWSEHHALDFVYMESLKGRELLRIKVPSYAQKTPEWTPEGMCQCPQIYFDPILAARVGELDKVTRRYNTGLTGFTQDGDGVTAEIEDDGGRKSIVRARYLVGCDGTYSTVRNALDIGLGGIGAIANSVNIFFRSPGLAQMHAHGWARIYRPIDEAGCWAELIPIDGRELWRLTVFEDSHYEKDPDAALLRMAGGSFDYEILSTLLWERRDAVAESYGKGRVLIAGDSAHQSSPTGGAGMHTGMEEAVNLAWKLEAVLKGWGGPGLLPSYEAERKPIAQRNIELSTATFRALRSIPAAREALASEAWKGETPKFSIPDHVRSCPVLEGSPVIVDDGSAAIPQVTRMHEPSTRPGARAPHAWLEAPANGGGGNGRSTIDLLGDGFTLLRLGTAAPDSSALLAAARQRGVPMREVAISDPGIAKLYERPLVLVRPDYHVAWRGSSAPSDPLAIVDRIRGAEA